MRRPAVEAPPERVVVIPEAGAPRRDLGRLLVVAVVAALVGLAGGGAAVYAWQQDRVAEREAALASARAARADAQARADTAERRFQELSGRVASLRERLSTARRGIAVLSASGQEARRLVQEFRSELGIARARSAAMLGQPLSDGRYIGRVLALGSAASPPRLVFDLQQWLSGAAAVRAAREDGAIGPEGTLSPRRYLRNASPAWRVIEVDPSARVVLRDWGGIQGRTVVSLARLATILERPSIPARRLSRDPFWITVGDARVVSIRHQPYVGP